MPQTLAADFGTAPGAGPWGRALARACYEAAPPSPAGGPPRLVAAYGEALGLAPASVESERAYRALRRAYAYVVALVATRSLDALAGTPEAFASLAGLEATVLERAMGGLAGRSARHAEALAPIEGMTPWAGSWTPALASALREAIQRLSDYPAWGPAEPTDLFRLLYEGMLPHAVRHAMGEFYTPRWLVEAVLEALPATPGWRGLDPCCGSGAFLMGLIAEVLAETAGQDARTRLAAVGARVHGRDLNSLAVLTARVNYVLAIAPLLAEVPDAPFVMPVLPGDALCWRPETRYERVVGNPPWVSWKDLPAAYRTAIQHEYRDRGLLSGEAYAGGTDLNLCALIAHGALDQLVAPGGGLAFLMPRQLLVLGAARGFRRMALAEGRHAALVALDDWQALKPFEAACHPCTFVYRCGAAEGAVPVRRLVPRDRTGRPPEASWKGIQPSLRVIEEAARPLSGPGSPYMIDAPEALDGLLALMGESAYRGRRGVETSPHGIFWVRSERPARARGCFNVTNGLNPRAKERIAPTMARLEPDCLMPFLRGAGIRAFGVSLEPHWLIFPHAPAWGAAAVPPEEMPPLTLAYLEGYREVLMRRGSFKEYRRSGPFYGLWRVGPYTFAPHKVVWPEIGELRAAVVSSAPGPSGTPRLVIPEGKVNYVGVATADEAHYLCALLNAPRLARAYRAMSSQLGRPSRLPFALPAYDPTRWTHRALAEVSRAAHAGRLSPMRWEPLLDRLLARALAA